MFFFVDDQFSDSKEVLAIPARHRLAAVGLWTLCGSWSAGKMTDGHVPNDVLRRFGARPALVDALCGITGPAGEDWSLWTRLPDGIRFTNWSKWQRTREQVVAYKQAQRDKKRGQRKRAADAVTSGDDQMSLGDIAGDSEPCPPGTPQTPIPIPTPRTTGHLSSTVTEPNASAPPRPRSRTFTEMAGGVEHIPPPDPGPHVVKARQLVRDIIPRHHPNEIRGKLVNQAARLLADGHPAELVADALRLWLTKPHLGPGVLPSLVSEVLRTRDGPPAALNGAAAVGRASAKATSILDAAERLTAARPPTDHTQIGAP